MNKEIKRMTTIIGNVKPFYVETIAEALYNAGYRKVGSDAKGNLLKIQNLCIEFDEMGYEPTTLCENPEQTAKKWKSDLMYEIGLFLDEAMGIKARYNELKAENERLKEKCEELLNEKWDAQDDLDCYCDEMPTRINQAVKEFADEIKAKLNAIFGKTICSDLDTEDITDIIDELLKEIEKQ